MRALTLSSLDSRFSQSVRPTKIVPALDFVADVVEGLPVHSGERHHSLSARQRLGRERRAVRRHHDLGPRGILRGKQSVVPLLQRGAKLRRHRDGAAVAPRAFGEHPEVPAVGCAAERRRERGLSRLRDVGEGDVGRRHLPRRPEGDFADEETTGGRGAIYCARRFCGRNKLRPSRVCGRAGARPSRFEVPFQRRVFQRGVVVGEEEVG